MLDIFEDLDQNKQILIKKVLRYHFDESSKKFGTNAKAKQVRAWIEKIAQDSIKK